MSNHKDTLGSWLVRLLKGAVIGTGFIIPGVSGGVFAAIFGVYEPMIRFFANITKDFWKNVRFFLPIGIGGLLCMVVVSKLLGDFFKVAEVPLIWFFIGCVLGTLPALWAQAGKQGRKPLHPVIMALAIIAMGAFLFFIQGVLERVSIPVDNPLTWLLAGALMALGAVVPGLSPSNFLVFLNIYPAMMTGIGGMNLMVLLPVLIGAATCFLSMSKVFAKLFDRAYTGMYHAILGIILASTMMIIPWSGKPLEIGGTVSYDAKLVLISIGACVAGVALGYGMGLLEKKYKGE